ncbi:MAG: 50S ribosomal protein L11 methyltransferase [Candidatus Kapaibacteriales bacterium]
MELEKYVYVFLKTKEELIEQIVAYLSNYPLLGAEEQNDFLTVYFKNSSWEKIDKNQFFEVLKLADPDIQVLKVETFDEINWNEEWEKNITPVIISRNIAIVPSWKIGSTGKKIEIVIDPKMSFGTGHHSTTQIMCRFAEKLVQKDSFWIDVGTGTGILAILARKLGAREILAFDNNFWSLQNAFENFRKNKIENGIDLIEMDIDATTSLPEADGIFANLNLDLILRNLQKFYKSLYNRKGSLIISGVLIYDLEELVSRAKEDNFEIVETMNSEEWIGAHLIPK